MYHMSFDQNGGFSRQMYDVSAMGLKCADCGVAINELPFEPKADRPVYCRDCNRNHRKDAAGGARGGFGGGDRGFAPRQSFDVSSMGLKCADCGVAINELPFEPKADRPVYCRDCNRNRRQSFGR
jgi:CxxC-x17-CxxC domain-containing protein